MKKIYIHIGQPKTGTTALQKFWYLNKELMLKDGILYPYVDREIELAAAFGSGNGAFLSELGKVEEKYTEKENLYIEKLKNMLDENSTILLSSEILWSSSPQIVSKLTKTIGEKYGCQIKVIAYLRRQDEALESEWNQRVKMNQYRYSGTCEEWVKSRNEYARYDTICDKIADVIGKENLIIRIYSHDKFTYGKKNSIYADFMSILGIEDISEYELPRGDVNPALNANQVEIRRIFNMIPESIILDRYYAKLRGEQSTINKAPSFLTYEQRKYLLDSCEEGNRKIGREYFGIDASPFPVLERPQEAENSGGGYHNSKILLAS